MSGLQGSSSMVSGEVAEESSSSRAQPSITTRSWKLPRRYAMAIMFNIAFFIIAWMTQNIAMIFYHLYVSGLDKYIEQVPTIVNFTISQNEKILISCHSAFIIGQIPSAMLSVQFSCYRILQISMMLSAFLQLITPWTLKISSHLFIFNLILQSLSACPLESACIGLWRKWAPPTEKTHLLLISLSGVYVYPTLALPLCSFLSETVSPASLHYFAGIVGVMWCIIWTCVMSEDPSADPLISESESQFLEEKIPLKHKENITLTSVPLKSIIKSLPVISLCLIVMGLTFSNRLSTDYFGYRTILLLPEYGVNLTLLFVLFVVINSVVLLPLAGILVDYLINRKIVNATTARKILCCGGLVLHAVFMLMFWVFESISALICLLLPMIFITYTLAGALPNILELSPRYACVIMGLTQIGSSVASLVYEYLLVYFIPEGIPVQGEWVYSFVPVALIAITAAILFFFFGSGDEQSWPQSNPSSARHPNDSQLNPQTDLEEEALIATDL